MITDSEKLELAYTTFLVNASERLEEIEQDLLNLKGNGNHDRIDHLIQLTYALRGTAESLEFSTVSIVAHLLEEILKRLLNPRVVVDPELEALLLRGYECLKLPLKAKLTGTQLDEPEILKWIITIFAQLHLKLESFGDRRQMGSTEHRTHAIPSDYDSGADVTQAIFETWIGKRLANLAYTSAHGDAEAVAAYLREQARVFVDISMQLNLTGFKEIAETALLALDLHPQEAATIAHVALADFLKGQTLVLAGDRTCGGQPSEKLLQLSANDAQIQDSPLLPDFVSMLKSEQAQNHHPSTNSKPLSRAIEVDAQELESISNIVSHLLTSQTQQTAAHQKLQHYFQSFQRKLLNFQEKFVKFQPFSSSVPTNPELCSPLKITHEADQFSRQPHLAESIKNQSVVDDATHLEKIANNLLLIQLPAKQLLQKQQQYLVQIQQRLDHLRALPLGHLYKRMPQFIERWTKLSGKQAHVRYEGHDVLISKEIIGKLDYLILTLVRDALIQGIENPDVRHRLGKAAEGQVYIKAEQRSGQVTVAISHDGNSLDFEQIRRQAVQMQLQTTEQVAGLSEQQLMDLLIKDKTFANHWNYSLIGLGIGFKQLLTRLYELDGSIRLFSKFGQGTTFLLSLIQLSEPPIPLESLPSAETQLVNHSKLELQPVSLQQPQSSISRPRSFDAGSLQVSASESVTVDKPTTSRPLRENFTNIQSYCLKTESYFAWLANSIVFFLPFHDILESVSLSPDQVIKSKEQRFMHWHEQVIPLYSLSELLNQTCRLPQTLIKDQSDAILTLVIQQDQRLFSVESVIKNLITQPEIKINPLDDKVQLPTFISGCTVVEDNHVAFVVNASELIRQAIQVQPQKGISSLA